MHDLHPFSSCPNEIAKGEPVIALVDNIDFKNDTLTGGGQAHRTNVMHVQPKSPEGKRDDTENRVTNSQQLSSTLTDITSDIQYAIPYKTVKCGEPTLRQRFDADISAETTWRRPCLDSYTQ